MADEATERVLQLVDFLADYDAQRNQPVYDVSVHGLLLKGDDDIPAVPGVQVTGSDAAWLTVDFVELPARPLPPRAVLVALGLTRLTELADAYLGECLHYRSS